MSADDMISKTAALAIERSIAKSMAFFVTVKEWEAYKAGVQEYAAAIAALPAVTVGMKPTFYFDRYINGVRMAEDVCVERETTLERAMLVAARIASKGPNGEAPVLVYRAPVTPAPDAAAIREATARLHKLAYWLDTDAEVLAEMDDRDLSDHQHIQAEVNAILAMLPKGGA